MEKSEIVPDHESLVVIVYVMSEWAYAQSPQRLPSLHPKKMDAEDAV